MNDPKARKKLESIIKNDYRDYLIENKIGYPSFKSHVLWLVGLKERGFDILGPRDPLMETIRGFKPRGESDEKSWDFSMFVGIHPTKSVFVVSVPEELALRILVLGEMP